METDPHAEPLDSRSIDELSMIDQGGTTVRIVPSAGMCSVSMEHGGVDRLWLPCSLEEFVRTPRTGGIPLLYPWANRLRGDGFQLPTGRVDLGSIKDLKRDDSGLPIHGLLLRWNDWRIEALKSEPEETAIAATLDWQDHEHLMSAFPVPHRLRVEWSLRGDVLEILTRIDATGEIPVPICFGWHPYLCPGGERPSLHLETPRLQGIRLDDRSLPVRNNGTLVDEDSMDPNGPIGDRVFDDLYRGVRDGDEASITDGSTTVTIRFIEGYRYMQLYSPEGSRYACFEPMTAPAAALSDGSDHPWVQPGSHFTARFSIRITSS
ncbi:MAG: hypothetical protein CMJ32_11345 [Phycisphaerae bacterium]|nr:hypothetical protein [Phycisphaerae bacterium]